MVSVIFRVSVPQVDEKAFFMKILLCTSTFQHVTHGPAKFAQLILQINQRFPSYEVRILTEEIDQAIPDQVYKINPKYPRPVQAFWPFLNNYSYRKGIIEIHKTYPFDVLIFNNALMGWWSAFKKPRPFKVVGLVHDDDYLSAKLSNFSFTKKWFINIHRKPLERLATRAMDLTIANSDYINQYLQKTYKLSSVKTLYQSIDLNHFPFVPRMSIDINQPIKVLFVKADYPRGGLKLLVEALTKLPHEFILTVMGPKEEEKQTIQRFFKSSKNVSLEFKGPCSQSVVIRAMQNCDIFCVPAHKEGLGMANFEALASGAPVVSTPVGGIPEVLDYGRNGWLAETVAPAALAHAFDSCIKGNEERYTKSKNARNFVEEYFSHEKMLKKLLEYISGLNG